jgi:hypothetical protein
MTIGWRRFLRHSKHLVQNAEPWYNVYVPLAHDLLQNSHPVLFSSSRPDPSPGRPTPAARGFVCGRDDSRPSLTFLVLAPSTQHGVSGDCTSLPRVVMRDLAGPGASGDVRSSKYSFRNPET